MRFMLKAVTFTLVLGFASAAHAQSAETVSSVVRSWLDGTAVTRGWVLGNVRSIRNAAGLGLYRLCIPENVSDGAVAAAVIVDLGHHARRQTVRGRTAPDLAMIESMSEMWPCRN
jgi:hypothetical protein